MSKAGGRGRTDVVAVDDVAFAIAPGRSLAIVGESGSGKTTTARMVMGLEQPTAGRISLGGVERGRGRLRSRERRRYGREIQIVFQDPFSSLDPRQRVGDAVEEVLKLHFDLSRGRSLGSRRSSCSTRWGSTSGTRGRLPRALSGGQQQRVAIARALASMPKVLILDEAVASLDVSIQAQVLNLLADIREETGVTYLFISHDLAVVRQVSDDVIVMRRGQIVERGPTARVLDQPQDPYTRTLLSAVPRRGWKPTRHKMARD